jgi:hypothetical protein
MIGKSNVTIANRHIQFQMKKGNCQISVSVLDVGPITIGLSIGNV